MLVASTYAPAGAPVGWRRRERAHDHPLRPQQHIPLLWTHLIPATLEGRATHNVQNADVAAAMAFSLVIKLDAIRQGLRTFDSTFFQAPGRMNVFNEHPSRCCSTTGTTPTRWR